MFHAEGARRRPRRSPVRFPGLVVIARAKHPIPSRTRPLSAAAPMVLRPKTRESRSPPNLKSPRNRSLHDPPTPDTIRPAGQRLGAGWSSPVARQAHNLKVAGSNPAPATNDTDTPEAKAAGVFAFCGVALRRPLDPVQDRPQVAAEQPSIAPRSGPASARSCRSARAGPRPPARRSSGSFSASASFATLRAVDLRHAAAAGRQRPAARP